MNDKHITNTGQIIREYNPWFDWYPDQMLPTCPTGDYRLSLRLRDGSAVSEIARSVLWKDNGSRTVLQYRWIDPRVVVRNPYTGEVRHWGDICQDPEGKLIVTPTPGPIVREQTCACFDGQCRGQVVDGKLSNGDLCRQTVAHEAMDDTLVVEFKTGTFQDLVADIAHAEVEKRKHNHYFKDVRHLDTLDVYRVLSLFNVTDPCIQHAVKKLLVAGGRGAGKDISRDIKEAIDSLQRWQEMRQEDEGGVQ